MLSLVGLGEILIILIVVGLPVLCATLVILAMLFRGKQSQRRELSDQEETRLIQELHQSMSRLERRIESIETIVLESESRKEKSL